MKNELPESGISYYLQLFLDNSLSPQLEQQIIDDLNLSPRSKNCLKRADVNTISQLISLSKDKIKSIRNLGWKSIREIIDRLQELPVSDEIIIRFKQAQTECFVEHDKTNIEKLIINEEIINVLHSVGITTVGELLLYSEEELLLISQKEYEGEKSILSGFGVNEPEKLLKYQIGKVEIEEIKNALLKHGMYRNHLASIEDIEYRMLLLEKETDFTIEDKRLIRINQKKYLATVKIPTGITTIEHHAFRDQPIKEVYIPEGVTRIKGLAFNNCFYLEKILFPESMRIIESNSFWPCPSIRKIVIPNNVQDCGDGSFDGCNYLQEIVMPARLLPKFVKWRYSCLPDNCKITVSDLKDKLLDDFIIDSLKLLKYVGNKPKAVIAVPDGIVEIADGAFANSSIKEASLPTSVTKIGKYAFWGCKDLEYIKIPNSVQQIGFFAFEACFSLLEISLPKGLIPELEKYGIKKDGWNDNCKITISDAP